MCDQAKLRTVPEAAEWLGIAEGTLRNLVAARKVPHTRLGAGRGSVRFAQHHLDAIVQAGEEPVLTVPTRTQVRQIRANRRAA